MRRRRSWAFAIYCWTRVFEASSCSLLNLPATSSRTPSLSTLGPGQLCFTSLPRRRWQYWAAGAEKHSTQSCSNFETENENRYRLSDIKGGPTDEVQVGFFSEPDSSNIAPATIFILSITNGSSSYERKAYSLSFTTAPARREERVECEERCKNTCNMRVRCLVSFSIFTEKHSLFPFEVLFFPYQFRISVRQWVLSGRMQ